jgi:hypothetical protein
VASAPFVLDDVSRKRVVAKHRPAIRHYECSGSSGLNSPANTLFEIEVEYFVATAEVPAIMLRSEWFNRKSGQRRLPARVRKRFELFVSPVGCTQFPVWRRQVHQGSTKIFRWS